MKEFYGHTNESLWAIVAGMNVSREDRVLCICGSGDQSFALAEHAREVVAVDRNAEQISYAKRRLESLKNGNYDDFFPLFDDEMFPMIKNEQFVGGNTKDRLMYLHFMSTVKLTEDRRLSAWAGSIKYFLGEPEPFLKPPYGIFYNGDKIHKIRENVDRISFVQGDIINLLKEDNDFSRVYLSNALLSWQYNQGPKQKIMEELSILPKDCLVYMANTSSEKIKVSPFWKLKEGLSRKAKELELDDSWHPQVYRKVS